MTDQQVAVASNVSHQQKSMVEYLLVTVENQLFGVPVLQIQDVLQEQKVTKVPLAKEYIHGSLNLRGRIVTVIDVRKKLHMTEDGKKDRSMSVVVEHGGDLYSLMVDEIADVMKLPKSEQEKKPVTLDQHLSDVSSGIYQLDGKLMVVLNVSALLSVF